MLITSNVGNHAGHGVPRFIGD